jgi:hypothetical protein
MRKRDTDSVAVLIASFRSFLAAFDKHCPFTRYQLKCHVDTLSLRRRLGSAKAALDDDSFHRSLYETLRAWRIGARASNLRAFADFRDALHAQTTAIVEFDGLTIDQPDLDATRVGAALSRLAQSLDIVDNKTRIVPGSKALHHLLPELVVPIDRAYTQPFFQWANPTFQHFPERCFREAFDSFARIAREANPSQYVGDGWYTSRAKIIDNAIVGRWCWVKTQIAKTTS